MFYAGLDLGQRCDYAAFAVLERVEEYFYRAAPAFHSVHLRYLRRVPLGTPYTEVVAGVKRLFGQDPLRGQCVLTVDSTGVGAPVVEMLKDAGLGCEISAVTITGGETAHQNGSFARVTRWSVPKQDLMAGVQTLLEKGQLRIARDLPEAGALATELMDVQRVTKENGRTRLGADGSGRHDDLVIALALAAWRAKRPMNSYGTQQIPGI